MMPMKGSSVSFANRFLVAIFWLVFQLSVGYSQTAIQDQSDLKLTSAEFQTSIRSFLSAHCTRCHGAQKQKSDRRFDQLKFPISDDDMLSDFQDALDALNLGEMPPEGEPQPDDTEKAKVIAWIGAAIKDVQTKRSSTGETVLRRLNRREYQYTISDLFEIDIEGYDPTEGFPADQQVHHLDNQGAALVTSGFLLNQYLKAADEILEKALPLKDPPKEETMVFESNFRLQPEIHSKVKKAELAEIDAILKRKLAKLKQDNEKAENKLDAKQLRSAEQELKQRANRRRNAAPSAIRLYEHPNSDRHMGSYGYISDLINGVKEDGYYQITLDVETLYRKPLYDVDYAGTKHDEPMRMSIVPGDASYSDLQLKQPKEPELAKFELKDGKQTVSARIWLHAGTTPRFKWLNGSSKMRSAHIALGTQLIKERGYAKLVEAKKAAGERVPNFKEFLKNHSGNNLFEYGLTYGKLAQIRIHKVKLQGPIFEQWPTKKHEELLGGESFDAAKNEANLKQFLKRAYRRPVSDQEIGQIAKVIRARTDQGIAPEFAYRDGLKAALCSPGFLYLDEPVDEKTGKLSQYAIASRLSYFLWSTLPDDELFKAASDGKLTDVNELERQVERMLKDPRSDRFVKGFLDSWLTLSELGQAPPDRRLFKVFYSRDLGPAMRTETEMFTRHILNHNLSVDTFLDSDFTFANSSLAELYGLEFPHKDDKFHQVSVRSNTRRGGLLGHASVLTVTANGVDTSPITRGVWVLENILGTVPSPPPPDVEPLDPDTRGAKSIRDQLEKHRTNPTCAECHRKIDPLGFALENYDAIGRWRDQYPRAKGKPGVKIDASSKFASGETFKDVKEFRELISKQHREKFTRALAEKLMAYAIGRGVEIGDRPEMDSILVDLEKHDSQFRYLIKRIVTSRTFVRP